MYMYQLNFKCYSQLNKLGLKYNITIILLYILQSYGSETNIFTLKTYRFKACLIERKKGDLLLPGNNKSKQISHWLNLHSFDSVQHTDQLISFIIIVFELY